MQLSRCRQLRCISFCFRFQNCFETVQFSLSRTLKTIQNFSSQTQQISSLTLCVLLLILRFLLQLLTFVSLAVLWQLLTGQLVSLSLSLSTRSTFRMKLCSFLLRLLLRKEVIQPHLPIRLPCYDFTPVIGLTFDSWLLSVTSLASGAPNSHGVTGGVYKARERIHRGMLIRDY